MCMAELFRNSSLPVSFELAHCNFRLRGEESDGDEGFVEKWCSYNGVVCNKIAFDTSLYASSRSISIEMAARELRYSYFASLCRDKGFNAVAVAHNADDNAETLILNLLRGTGIRGLSGMRPLSPLPVQDASEIRLLRPLLNFTRKDIEAYIEENAIAYREDSTNALTDYRRNKIRHLVFPVFEEINPSFVHTLNKDMRRFAQAEFIAEDYYKSSRKDFLLSEAPGEIQVFIPSLLGKNNWKYLLFRILDEFSFNEDTLESLAALLVSGSTVSGRIFKGDGYEIVTAPDKIIIYKKEPIKAPIIAERHGLLGKFNFIQEGDECLVVEGCGLYEFRGRKFKVEKFDWNNEASPVVPEGVLIWDADKMPLPVLLRGWKKGDWMRPIGLKGRKKLSDIFNSLKHSLLDKEKAVVIVSPRLKNEGEEIAVRVAALLCLRLDEAVKITKETKIVYRIMEIADSEPHLI